MSQKEKSFEEKIQTLKEIHTRWDPQAIQQIRQWEERVARLKVESEWLNHPHTKEIRNYAAQQIDTIISVLANQRDLSEADRRAFFEQKEVHLQYLALFTSDPQPEIESIENAVDNELTP
jgi:hypothetical protein